MPKALVLECSPQLEQTLTALQATGFFGPSIETVAQRLLELKVYELCLQYIKVPQ
jgi:hypothetical protein